MEGVGDVPQQDCRGFAGAAGREHYREVTVGGDHDRPPSSPARCKIRIMAGCEQSYVGDVGDVLAGVAQRLDERGGEVRVEQEPRADRAIGTSCWLTIAAAYSSAACTSARSRCG